MCVLFVHVSVCLHVCVCMCRLCIQCSWKPEEAIWSPGTEVTDLWAATWVLGSDLKFSDKTAILLNCWATISPILNIGIILFNMYKCFACMHVQALCAYQVFLVTRKGWQIPWNWSFGKWWTAIRIWEASPNLPEQQGLLTIELSLHTPVEL